MKKLRKSLFFAVLVFLLSICTSVKAEEVAVSTIGELQAALTNGGKIKLNNDITSNEQLQLSQNTTLDLNGHTITMGNSMIIYSDVIIMDSSEQKNGLITNGDNDVMTVYVGYPSIGSLKLKSGTIQSTNKKTALSIYSGAFELENGKVENLDGGYPINGKAGTSVTINGGKVLGVSGNGITAKGELTINAGEVRALTTAIVNSGDLTIDGGMIYSSDGTAVENSDSASMTVTGGQIKTNAEVTNTESFYAILLNKNNELTINGGTISAPNSYGIVAFDNSQVVINDGNISSYYAAVSGDSSNAGENVDFEINGGRFESSKVAVYFPQGNGNNVITNGTFIAPSAIEIGAGKLNITGGNFTATNSTLQVESSENGPTTLGAALAVAQGSTRQPIEVNVSGGEFSGIAPINLANPQGNSEEDIAKVKINVSGGTYNKRISNDFIANSYTQYKVNNKYVVGKLYVLNDETITEGLEEFARIILESIMTNRPISGVDATTINAIKNAVNSDKEISMEMQLKEITEQAMTDEQKHLFTSKLKNNQTIASYFDIEVIVKADGETIGNITELPDKFKITVNLSELSNGNQGKYSVLRLHNGVVDTLNAVLNDDNTLTFESDKFSLYAVVYDDGLGSETNMSSQGSNVVSENSNSTSEKSSNPKTGDTVLLYVSMLGLSLIGFAATIFYIKRRKLN